jgi:protein phosphatase 1 regulatory subunit 21
MEDKAREADMRRYYEDKFTHLKSQLELADKSGLELISKSAKLEQTLEDAVSERDLLQQQISATNDRILRSKEELETTRENYEAQLKLLTEHLVSLNEKIGTYEEELSQIKSFKVKCGKCSGWNTVGWLMTEGKMGQRCSKGNHPSSLNYA